MNSLVSGSAFDADDIVDFLTSADDEDREKRYAAIRGNVDTSDLSDLTEPISFDAVEGFKAEMGEDLGSEFFVAPTEPHPAITDAARKSPKKRKATAAEIPNAKKKPIAKSHSFSLPSFDFREGTGTLLAATLVAVVVLAFFGLQLYHVVQGPEVRVVRGLD